MSKSKEFRIRATTNPDKPGPYKFPLDREVKLTSTSSKSSSPSPTRSARRKRTTDMRMVQVNGYDYSDSILSHLLDEGYADTLEAAEEILMNMSEEWIDDILDEKFSMAADKSAPQSPKPTKLPRSRERNIGHDDWKVDPNKRDFGERPVAGKKLKSRASAVTGTQRRQDVETGVRKESIDLAELFYVPPVKSKKPKSARKPSEKPDPKDPDYVEKFRKYIKSKQQQEATSVSEDMEGRWQRRAERQQELRQRSAEKQQAKSEKQSRLDTQATKGIPFYDKKGKGFIRKGVKYYDSDS